MGFTAGDIKTVVERYRDRLEGYGEALNGLNVYPVPDGDTGTNMAPAMNSVTEAASSVVDGEVTRAVRDATVAFGRIKQGDWIGVADGSIVVADTDLETTLRGLVAAILPQGSELITVYAGSGSSPATTKSLVAWMSELYPDLEVNVVDGEQPLYPYLVSIE